MQEKESIEQLFKEAFTNYEEPVRPELWSKISSAIQTTPPVADPASVVNSTISSGSGIFGSAAIWIAGAALVVLTGAGVYLYSSEPTMEVPANEQTIPQSATTEESTESINQQPAVIPQNLTENNNSERSNVSAEATENHTVTEAGPSYVAPSSQNINDENVTAITIDRKSTPTPVNQQHATSMEPVVQSNQNLIDEPNITPEQAKEEAATHFLVSPLSGTAPLSVDFIYSGDAEKTEWQFGDGYGNSQLSGTHHTFEKPGDYTVTLKIYDDAGSLITLNKIIKVQPGLQIYIPDIFTPNNDGLNDIFTFDAPNIADLEVLIYNQSGKFVYKWTGLEGGWDGKLNSGDVVPDGTYFYIIFATGENGQKHQQKGTISVKR